MLEKLEIHERAQGDSAAIEALYLEAFPDENLVPLVQDLLQIPVITVSLVGTISTQIVGHAIFTKCCVVGSSIKVALLGPLAVAPDWQKKGIGSAIVRTGLRRMEVAGVSLVCVLGDPAYYMRLGFIRESLVEPPFSLPIEWHDAWQSQYLGDTVTPCAGKLSVPPPWHKPTLWLP